MNTIESDLNAYYDTLTKGTSVCAFLEGFHQIIQHVHKAKLEDQYRLGRDENGIELKKLRDEVSPVARFVREHAQSGDTITFNLNDEYPDCTVVPQDGRKQGIEVTVARGFARYREMTKLNNCGESRPLIGLQDDAPKADKNAATNKEPEMYSTDDAINTVIEAVENSAEKKSKHKGDTLLIVLEDMNLLPEGRIDWSTLFANNTTVTNLEFSKVYVTSSEAQCTRKIK